MVDSYFILINCCVNTSVTIFSLVTEEFLKKHHLGLCASVRSVCSEGWKVYHPM
jgi:TctA family transporter